MMTSSLKYTWEGVGFDVHVGKIINFAWPNVPPKGGKPGLYVVTHEYIILVGVCQSGGGGVVYS